ncbi:MAG: D-alanyl-D-alanine carboxypeptidase family protein [Thermodesulfovibrionales bacterium]|jgi:D-alanyl-D-alanine carboxypeptidase (penicillin-binding protein 5/6)
MKQSSFIRSQPSARGLRSAFIIIFLLTIHFSVFNVFAADISSKAAVVMEASTGRILYGKNPDLRLAPASTTKLMTAMVTLDRMDPADTAVISERAAGVSPVKLNLKAGERVTVETLLNAALIKSANDAAYALAEATGGSEDRFVELMNQKVIALEMPDTNFVNATGLPGSGQYTTAYDLAKMLREALKYPLIKELINTKARWISTEEGRAIAIKNSDKLLWADETMLGGKTGYTREAKHCFVGAKEQGNETVIVALLGASSRQSLWRESEELLEKGFAVTNGKEEPVMLITKSEDEASVYPAAYSAKASDMKGRAHKKTRKTSQRKAKRGKSVTHIRKHKSRVNTEARVEKINGSKG